MAALPLGAQTLSLSDIVARVEQAQLASRARSVAYNVTREYKLSGANTQKTDAEVTAEVNFVPPSQKDYEIRKSEGNRRGTEVVRKVLEHETRMAGQPELSAFTRHNYDFQLLGREPLNGHDCFILGLAPKRAATDLIRGKLWADTTTGTIWRVEGESAKSPSFWIKNLHITINYADVSGMWMGVETRAVADVRLIGTHILTSKDINITTGTQDAKAGAPPRLVNSRRQRERISVADSALWVPRYTAPQR